MTVRSFEQMANEDPEISHMMAYRQVRRFVRMCDKMHRANARKQVIVAFNGGGIASVLRFHDHTVEPMKEWTESDDKK